MPGANQVNILEEKLRAYKRKYYFNLTVRGLIVTIAFISTVYVSFVIFEHFAQNSSSVRTFLFYTFLTALLVTAGIWVIRPIVRLYNLGTNLSDEAASNQIGNYFPEIRDKLLNTLQLGQLNYGDSSLLAATIDQRTSELSSFSFNEAIDIRKNRRFLKWIIFPATIVMVLVISNNGDILRNGTDRLFHPNKEFNDVPYSFNFGTEELKGFKNEEFVLEIAIDGKDVPEDIYVVASGMKRKMTRVDAKHYSYNFGNLRESVDFHIETAQLSSEEKTINILARPELKHFDAYLDYPSYLNKPSEKLSSVGNLTIPEGTTVRWDFNTTDTEELTVKFSSDKKKIKATKNGHVFTFAKQAVKSEDYQIQLKNQHSGNKDEIVYNLNVIKDQYPSIKVQQYQDTILFNYLLLGGNISDDYGISALTFNYNVIDKEGKHKYGAFKRNSIRIKQGQNNQSFFYQMELDSVTLQKGERLEYFVQVWDNDGVNGSKSARSRTYSFSMPDDEEIKESLDKSTQTSENQIDKTLEKAKDVKKELDKLHEKIKTKKKLDWQDKKLIEDALKEHKDLMKEMEKMQENYQEQTKKNERFNKQDEEMRKKAEMLQKLMEELMDEETKKLYEELQKLLQENANQEKIEKMLEQMKDKDEVAEKELERALEMFKQLKFEQKLEESIEELKELAKEQEELSQETKDKNSDSQELKDKQEELDKKFDEIKEDLKELNEINKSLENPNDMEDMDSEQKNVDQKMEDSKNALDKGQKKKASDSQKGASDEMKKMADKMQAMQESMQSEQMEEDLNALRDILENLITLSYDQEELMNDFKSVNQADPRFIELSQKQLKLQDDAQIIEDSLYSLAKRVFQIESFITREVTEMNKHMDKSSEALKQRKPGKASSHQQHAMTSMNNLALLLDDVLQQMQQQMGQEKQGDQMCNKPGKNKPGQSGQPKLGDMQKQLNQMIEQLKKSGKSGRALSEELAELAAQQEAIRQALKQMEDEMKKNGQKDGSNLGELQKQMEKTEEDLVNKNITPETIRRQKEILTRLLEAEKSMREREYENKRESQKAEQKERETPAGFEEYIKTKEKQIELLKTIPPSLTPYYKREVHEYFQNIEN